MNDSPPAWRRRLAQIVAITIVVALYGLTRAPVLDEGERGDIAKRFAFVSMPLEEPTGVPRQDRREVNPVFERHTGWISAVGPDITWLPTPRPSGARMYRFSPSR